MLNLFKSLADSTRLRLLRIMRQGDFTVQELTQILAMGQSRISRHLKILSADGVLRVEKQGTWHYYGLSPEAGLFKDIWPFVEKCLHEVVGQEQDAAGVLEVMAARRKRSQDFFDRHAREWDNMHVALLGLPDYQDALLAMVPSGGLLVEIGAGTGSLLPQLARKGDHTVGLDHAPSMVALARETLAHHPHAAKVEVRLAEMNHLPFPDRSVHAVVMNQVLHHAERPVEVLGEVGRVLERRGRLVIADLARHQHDWARERLADQWLGFNRHEIAGWLAEAGMVLQTYQELGNTATQQPVLLLCAGLADALNSTTPEDLSDDRQS